MMPPSWLIPGIRGCSAAGARRQCPVRMRRRAATGRPATRPSAKPRTTVPPGPAETFLPTTGLQPQPACRLPPCTADPSNQILSRTRLPAAKLQPHPLQLHFISPPVGFENIRPTLIQTRAPSALPSPRALGASPRSSSPFLVNPGGKPVFPMSAPRGARGPGLARSPPPGKSGSVWGHGCIGGGGSYTVGEGSTSRRPGD